MLIHRFLVSDALYFHLLSLITYHLVYFFDLVSGKIVDDEWNAMIQPVEMTTLLGLRSSIFYKYHSCWQYKLVNEPKWYFVPTHG